MSILRGFAVLGMCVAVLNVLSGCGADTVAQPGETATTTSAVPSSPPTTGPTTSAPASPPVISKTPKQSATPSKKPTAKPAPTPTARPTKPTGRIITVRSWKPHYGPYTELVRLDPERLHHGDYLTCARLESKAIVLKVNGTVPTDKAKKNFVSTLRTKAGLLVFAEEGSTFPSDTLIAGEKLYGAVPKLESGDAVLLRATSTGKGGWNMIADGKLVVCSTN